MLRVAGGYTRRKGGRSGFGRFDPRTPTLATLNGPAHGAKTWGVGGRGEVFVAQNRRTLAELTPATNFAVLVHICSRSTLVDLTPKCLTLVASSPRGSIGVKLRGSAGP